MRRGGESAANHVDKTSRVLRRAFATCAKCRKLGENLRKVPRGRRPGDSRGLRGEWASPDLTRLALEFPVLTGK